MQAKLAGRQLIMVFLDSAGKYSRIGDAERVRKWVTGMPAAATPSAAVVHAVMPAPVAISPVPAKAAPAVEPKEEGGVEESEVDEVEGPKLTS
jgi:D-alanyl-D-alanine endopeptidase (penicillin-binding protein 7)